MDEVITSTVDFLTDSIMMFVSMPPEQMMMTMWPFLFLSLPRNLLTQFVALGLAIKPEPSAKAKFRADLALNPPLVSVLLPGYNESGVLETAILALREQSYPNMEIVVVSDGSNDGMDVIGRKLERRGWIRFFNHAIRGGKSSAANFALRAARGDYIVICDADCTFDTDSIWHLMVEFYRPEVTAVAGNLRVRNAGTNILTRLQALQFILSIGVGRRAGAWLGILFIISGAFGAFRKSTLLTSGGWDTGPGEDADVTIKARLAGGEIAFAPLAMCMTDCPDSWYAFFRQQMRWNRSTVRMRLRKYRWIFNPFHQPFRLSNLLGCIDILVFQLVFAISLPFHLVWMYTNYHGLFWQMTAFVTMLYIAINFLSYAIALGLSERPMMDCKLLPYVPLYGFFIGIYLRTVRVLAYINEFLFKTSYKDTYVPRHVSDQTRMNDSW